jgi:bacteriocin biosynthesis cyclodehydratase domain-containing protein
MLSPGHHLYPGPDGRWRCAGPDDRFFALGGPPGVLEQVQRLVHLGGDGSTSPPTEQPAVTTVLDLLALHGVIAPADGDAPLGTERSAHGRPRVCVVGDNPVADQVRSLLAGRTTLSSGSLDRATVAAADVVVECTGWLPDARWRALAATCADHATPWHMTYVEGDSVVVGPMYVPGVTASYVDVRGRRLAAARTPGELLALWAYLDGDEPKPPVPWPDAAGAATIAGFVAADVLALVQGRRCPSEGHQLIVDPGRADVRRHRVLPLPSVASTTTAPQPAEAVDVDAG